MPWHRNARFRRNLLQSAAANAPESSSNPTMHFRLRGGQNYRRRRKIFGHRKALAPKRRHCAIFARLQSSSSMPHAVPSPTGHRRASLGNRGRAQRRKARHRAPKTSLCRGFEPPAKSIRRRDETHFCVCLILFRLYAICQNLARRSERFGAYPFAVCLPQHPKCRRVGLRYRRPPND